MLIDSAKHLLPPGVAPPSNETSDALASRLLKHTEGEVLFDAGSRGRYATDASIYQIMPVGVFVPKHERDIATAIDIARELKVPVLPRGGGSSQCGQAIGAALVVDNTKHFRGVLDINVKESTATVEPGLVLDHLNALLKPHGLWFPVDVSTSAQATLGGMAGNNSCGSRSIAYGRPRRYSGCVRSRCARDWRRPKRTIRYRGTGLTLESRSAIRRSSPSPPLGPA